MTILSLISSPPSTRGAATPQQDVDGRDVGEAGDGVVGDQSVRRLGEGEGGQDGRGETPRSRSGEAGGEPGEMGLGRRWGGGGGGGDRVQSATLLPREFNFSPLCVFKGVLKRSLSEKRQSQMHRGRRKRSAAGSIAAT